MLGREEMFALRVDAVELNGVMDEALFRFELPPDVPVVDADAIEPPETLPLARAIERASFELFLPRRVPAGADLHVSYQAPSEAPGLTERVYLGYVFPGGAHSLVISQTRASDEQHEPVDEWTSETREGRALHYRDHGSQREVELVRSHTRLRISSDLELETLIELALSLEPAPRETPGLVDASP